MISFLLSFYLFSDCLTIAWMPSTAMTSHQEYSPSFLYLLHAVMAHVGFFFSIF
ncbi:hypothetical protein F5146DRAFT_1075659 [Armillaria mellea]|nr:hypothetical protein F5146DRAFT_1080302 [Armillaria mellea]KAK0184219.1 hypothetical protein F5146DRAFT_1075659 [Armillaria mellea]